MSSTRSLHAPTPAGLGIRLGARVINVLVVTALAVGLGQWMGFGWDWLLAGAAAILAYFAGFDAIAGATPGKLAVGLRVVGPDGGRPALGQAVRREAFTLLGAVPFAGPLLALGAWIWIAMTIRSSPRGQGAHDRLAGGTCVVRAG